jgi:hypothetical protein
MRVFLIIGRVFLCDIADVVNFDNSDQAVGRIKALHAEENSCNDTIKSLEDCWTAYDASLNE